MLTPLLGSIPNTLLIPARDHLTTHTTLAVTRLRLICPSFLDKKTAVHISWFTTSHASFLQFLFVSYFLRPPTASETRTACAGSTRSYDSIESAEGLIWQARIRRTIRPKLWSAKRKGINVSKLGIMQVLKRCTQRRILPFPFPTTPPSFHSPVYWQST